MNIQAMMKQAQKLQKDMTNTKNEIDAMEFTVTKSFITVIAKGNKTIQSIKIDMPIISEEEKEIVEDLIVVAMNEVFNQIDKLTEEKLGKYTQGMPGLF